MVPIARFRIGEFDLAVISDGYMKLDAGVVMGIIPKVMWEPVLGPGAVDDENRMRLDLNCLVVRGRGETVIVDTGMGTKHDARVRERMFPGDYGHLIEGLTALGIAPDDVTAVVNTHLHTDHCGWNTMRSGDEIVPTFARARYFVQRGEFDEASHPNERTRGTYFAENFAPLAAMDRLELVDGERAILPGLHFLATPGHTAHHAAVAIASGGDTAIFCGDLFHHAVQVERFPWIPAFDVLPLVSLETKKRLAERALRDRALLISAHLDFPGAGHLVEEDGRRRFVPA